MLEKLFVSLILLSFFLASQTLAAEREGLVLHLSFDEGSGDVARDGSGNGNDGVVEEAEWIGGKIDGALEFDGANAGVIVEKDASIEPSEAISIMTWLRLNNSNGNHEIVRKQIPNGKGYDIRIQNGALHWWVNVGGWNNSNYQQLIPADEWVFLTGTYDGSISRIYINGEAVASNKISGNIIYDDAVLLIGTGAPHDPNYKLNGALDDFAIFNRALPTEAVEEIMGNGIAATVSFHGKLAATWAGIKLQ